MMRLLIGAIAIAFALNNLAGWARNRPAAGASWPRGVGRSALSRLASFVAHAGSALAERTFYTLRYRALLALGVTLVYAGLAS